MKEPQIRAIAEAVIRRVMSEARNAGQPLAPALDAAYPFGTRHGQAYKIWRDQVRRSTRSDARGGAAA